jgi:hypothetical protein
VLKDAILVLILTCNQYSLYTILDVVAVMKTKRWVMLIPACKQDDL